MIKALTTLLIILPLSGCEYSDAAAEQDLACQGWGGYASHQYSRMLEGDYQFGELSRYAQDRMKKPDLEHVRVIESMLEFTFDTREDLSHDEAVWLVGQRAHDMCLEGGWSG